MLTHRNTAEQNDAIVAAAVAEWREAPVGWPAGPHRRHLLAARHHPRDPEVGTDETPFASAFPSRLVVSSGFQFTQLRFDRIDQRAITVTDRVEPEQRRPDDSATPGSRA